MNMMMLSWIYTHLKICQIKYFKYVEFIMYQCCLNKAVNELGAEIWSLARDVSVWWGSAFWVEESINAAIMGISENARALRTLRCSPV